MSTVTGDAPARRAEVQHRLAALEGEIARLRNELATLGEAQRLPGLYLTIEVAGGTVLVPADAVLEVVRLVALEPLPAAPAHVPGAFVYRGSPAVVVDLAVLVGQVREPELDAHLVVCAGAHPVALLVDRVRGMVEGPQLVAGSASGEGAGPAWDRSGVLAGMCLADGQLVPLLKVSAVLAAGRERA